MRVARTTKRQDFVIKVLCSGEEGRSQLDMLRKIATGPETMLNRNHCLPMLNEIVLENAVFGVFPKASCSLESVMGSWAFFSQNSAGDIADMMMQALEALDYIHGLNIAHRVRCFKTYVNIAAADSPLRMPSRIGS